MVPQNTTKRRRFLATAAAFGSLAGCVERFVTDRSRPGVIEASDLTIASSHSAEVTAKNVEKEDDVGIEISTNDSITDGQAVVTIPISIPNASACTVYVNADVDELDDDTSVEMRFHSTDSVYRIIYIGNEHKTKPNGVLATETGSGYELRKPLAKLPAPDTEQTSQIDSLSNIRFVIRDGDFIGKLWVIWFIFEDRSIGVL